MLIQRATRLPLCLILLLLQLPAFAATLQETQWKGYKKSSFAVDGRSCYIVEPEQTAAGKPWVWRARFPGYHSQIDELLLADGYHIAHMDTGGMLGSPAALVHWEAFYKVLTEEHSFHKKAVLYGVSRGGLFVYRWAKAHPGTVACIYNDTPVCDLKSWPGGRGAGKGDANTWSNVLEQYGLDEAAALAYADNPIDNLEPIAAAQIPIMHIVTEDDRVVPPLENTYVMQERLRALGHSLFYVVSLAKGLPRASGHHFDLTHPEIGANFIKKYSEFGEEHPIYLRSGLQNSRYVFEKTMRGRVAFLGGSITEMSGWRQLVAASLQKRFPDTQFDFVYAGISSTDSTMGAFRLEQDIFGRGQVDLLFMESAVNELHNSRTQSEIQRATEGIMLGARRQNPNIDIIAQYFFDMRYVMEVRKGKTPWQIAALERVALQYGTNAIDQTVRCTTLFDSGQMSTEEFGGVHPKPTGHRVYADMLDALFDKAWAGPPASELSAHEHSWRIDSAAFGQGHFQSIETAEITRGWQIVENWQAKSGSLRGKDAGATYMEALEPGAELRVEFTGTAIGLPMIAGPDVGILEFSVDGAEFKTLDQFTRWSGGLHIPWIYMLETDLPAGAHRLTLRTTDKQHEKSSGYACRFRYFAVNGPH